MFFEILPKELSSAVKMTHMNDAIMLGGVKMEQTSKSVCRWYGNVQNVIQQTNVQFSNIYRMNFNGLKLVDFVPLCKIQFKSKTKTVFIILCSVFVAFDIFITKAFHLRRKLLHIIFRATFQSVVEKWLQKSFVASAVTSHERDVYRLKAFIV